MSSVPSYYHRISGQSVGRIEALSDGTFAIAMTLLVFELKVPLDTTTHHQTPLWDAGAMGQERVVVHVLAGLAPTMLVYFLSFLTLAMFWVGQQTQLSHLVRSNRHLTWIHLAFLLAVGMMPFSTSLLAEYTEYRLALVEYWFHLLVLGMLLLAGVRYAEQARLLREDLETTPGMRAASERRIIVAQVLYFGCLLLSVVSTYLSIALITLLQLNSAIAPRIRPLDKF